MNMASRLPKPSGLKPPQIKIARPLQPISENGLNRAHEAPAASLSRFVPSARLRRSKSVTDVRNPAKPLIDLAALRLPLQAKKAQTYKKTENKPGTNTPPKKGLQVVQVGSNLRSNKPAAATTRAGIAGTKRPLPAIKSNSDGQPKPKVQKKIPDWDYKSRFFQLNEKFTSTQESMKEIKSKVEEFDQIKSNYEKFKKEAEELTKIKDELTMKCDELTSQNKALLEKDEKTEGELILLKEKYRQLLEEIRILEENDKKLLTENETYIKEVSRLTSSLTAVTEHCTSLTLDLQQFQVERRVLHNLIQDLKGNIRVFCRVRPPINAEEQERLQCCINYIEDSGLEIRKSRESVSQITGKVQEFRSEFMFDKVFSPTSTQEEIFEDLSQLVQSALDGYHVCVFAYGQTGSGKTYTMQGEDMPERKGMIPRTIDLIFHNISKLERSGWKYKVQASFLEIYNEHPQDLLNMNKSQRLEICFNEGKGTSVTNLTIQPIGSAKELKEFMKLAHQNRATAATDFNQHSSRSHAVTKIYLEGTMNDQNLVYNGSLNLVDLAGSENAKQSVSGERLTETKNINRSLSTLGDVISALNSKSKHVPYRNSKLTYLLQSCLGGNSKTLMVVNISPFEECFNESISSLRFAAKVKEVKNVSKRNKMAFEHPMIKQKSIL